MGAHLPNKRERARGKLPRIHRLAPPPLARLIVTPLGILRPPRHRTQLRHPRVVPPPVFTRGACGRGPGCTGGGGGAQPGQSVAAGGGSESDDGSGTKRSSGVGGRDEGAIDLRAMG
eukprot:scaffold29079_cov84-Isochrysis_galbana.AAC.1